VTSKSAPTLHDVAIRAGVSKVTASMVLNGSRSNTRVSEPTRQRILAAAADLRYQPNAVARSLRRRHTDIIGFYSGYTIMDASDAFLSQVISGLQDGCELHRKDLLLHGLFRHGSVAEVYAQVANGMVDGLLLYSPPSDRLVDLLAESFLPVVVVVDAIPSLPCVVVDDAHGGRLQAEYLARRGHRRVLYKAAGVSLASVDRRQAAFLEVARGLDMVVTVSPDHSVSLSPAEVGLVTSATQERCTVVVCWDDATAYNVVQELSDLGLRIPDDAAVVGFNGTVPRFPLRWNLTTVRASWRRVAQAAIEVLLIRMAGGEAPRETVLPVELVAGDTA
jgi:LacI family transcriptional regulator/LacI family purine nucleotide synthesis repressor